MTTQQQADTVDNDEPEGAATAVPTGQRNMLEDASHESKDWPKGAATAAPTGQRNRPEDASHESKDWPEEKMDLSSHHFMLEVPENYPDILATCKHEDRCDDSGHGNDSGNSGNCEQMSLMATGTDRDWTARLAQMERKALEASVTTFPEMKWQYYSPPRPPDFKRCSQRLLLA